MENSENFAENYYPKDLFSKIDKQNQNADMNKNTQFPPSFSLENLVKLIGGNENLASLLLSKNLKNDDKNTKMTMDNPIFSLLNQSNPPKNIKKEEITIDLNSFEEY